MKVSYNWLQEYIDNNLPEVTEVARALTMHSFEIEGVEDFDSDKVIDVKVLPNRAHDCLSHYGIASELSSVLNLKRKELLPQVSLEKTDKINLNISTKSCSRQMMVLVTGVKPTESPEWLKEKLSRMGSRSINSIVDITNYLTFAFGQPMHAFDASKVSVNKKGQYEFNIREAVKGEKITLLDGKEYSLETDMMVIADGSKPLDVAGVMGGLESGVTSGTTDIILSFSGFNPVSVRKTSKALGIRTDASSRFENEISPSLIDRILPYVFKLIVDLTGGTIVGGVDIYKNPQKETMVSVGVDKISKMLGVTIDGKQAVELLAKQEISAEVNGEKINVKVPLHRLDLKIPEDIVEEVGRLYGYENISPQRLSLEAKIEVNKQVYISDSIRNILAGLGFTEIYTYAFVDSGEVEVANPLASDKKFLRSNLGNGMEESLEKNFKYLDLLGITEVKLFEIGKVFTKNGESLHLSLGIKYPKNKKESADEEIARTIQKIEEIMGISIGDASVVGGVVEFDLERVDKELGPVLEYPVDLWEVGDKNVSYKPISVFPFAVRDVAVFVPNGVSVENVENLIKEKFKDFVVRFSLFDKFTKEDKTSYAFRMVFQANDRTLTEEEINSVMDPIYDTLKAQEGFEIR